MILITDSNILLSALIRDSITRKIILDSGWKLYYPQISFREIISHKNLVLSKSGMTKREFSFVLSSLLKNVELIPDEKLKPHLKKAKETIGKTDLDDVAFIAAAMAVKDSAVWSDDAHFRMQDKIKIFRTKEIIQLFFRSKI
ncbi:MAG: PIN domain-containing protein [Candidatus Woesearchaeota archaeon]